VTTAADTTPEPGYWVVHTDGASRGNPGPASRAENKLANQALDAAGA